MSVLPFLFLSLCLSCFHLSHGNASVKDWDRYTVQVLSVRLLCYLSGKRCVESVAKLFLLSFFPSFFFKRTLVRDIDLFDAKDHWTEKNIEISPELIHLPCYIYLLRPSLPRRINPLTGTNRSFIDKGGEKNFLCQEVLNKYIKKI